MRALITNDLGIDSAGLRMLARVAVAAGLKATVAAPDGERVPDRPLISFAGCTRHGWPPTGGAGDHRRAGREFHTHHVLRA